MNPELQLSIFLKQNANCHVLESLFISIKILPYFVSQKETFYFAFDLFHKLKKNLTI